MTRKQWVRQMPWQLAAAGAVAGALFGVNALYSASTAFADCRPGPGSCNQNTGPNTNWGNNGNQGKGTQFVLPPQQPQQQQTFQFSGHSQNNSGPSNTGQSGQTFNLQQWQNNQQQVTTQTPPTLNQNVQQFVQQLQDKWQQPQTAPAQVTIPAYVPPVVVQPVVVPQVAVDPPPVVNVQNTTNRKRSTDSAPVVTSQTVAEVVAAVTPLFTAPPKVDPPAPKFFSPTTKPIVPDFTGPVQQAAAAPALAGPDAVGPDFFNNNDPWWWWWFHHHPKPHIPPPPPPPPPPPAPPPPPPPPVVYSPPVFHRTVVSCASVQPYYQTGYPYANMPYGNLGMPYGYNPYIFNQPVAPNYAPTYGYGQGSVYQQGYPYNNGYPLGYNNVNYNNGYPYGNQYSNYVEQVNTPYGILIIHHVLVACAPPVQQQVYSVAVAAPATPSYQPVVAAPQVYAPVVQQRGPIAPPRTGDAGLIGQGKSRNAWLPDFVLLGLLSLFSAGVMARARQR